MVDEVYGSNGFKYQIHDSSIRLEPMPAAMNRLLSEFRALENLIFVVTILAVIVTFAMTAEGQTPGDSPLGTQAEINSSRRGSSSEQHRPRLLPEVKPMAKLQSSELSLEGSGSDDVDHENEASSPKQLAVKDSESASDETDDNEEQPEDVDSVSTAPTSKRLDEMKSISTDTRSLRINIAETSSEAPEDESNQLVISASGDSLIAPSEKRFAWAAPDIRYQPLYFEDVALERYGQTPCGCELRQTALSAAHFFKSAALLPYQMIEQDPHSCDWPLGFCRPGTETPFIWQKHIRR